MNDLTKMVFEDSLQHMTKEAKAAYNREYYRKNKDYWREYYKTGAGRGRTHNYTPFSDYLEKNAERRYATFTGTLGKKAGITTSAATSDRSEKLKSTRDFFRNAGDAVDGIMNGNWSDVRETQKKQNKKKTRDAREATAKVKATVEKGISFINNLFK